MLIPLKADYADHSDEPQNQESHRNSIQGFSWKIASGYSVIIPVLQLPCFLISVPILPENINERSLFMVFFVFLYVIMIDSESPLVSHERRAVHD